MKSIIFILLVVTLLISGCTTSNPDITGQDTVLDTTSQLESEISESENLDSELESVDDINLDELDF